MTPTSPTVARWELALRIRRRRKETGVTVAALCETFGFTPAYWSLIETYRNVFTKETLLALFDALDFAAADREELLQLRAAAREKGWWGDYSALIGEIHQRCYGLEFGAASICAHRTALIPELLQTEDYAHALISADSAAVRRMDVEPLVEIRMRRQRRLHDADPVRLDAVIGEAALLQRVGGPAVLRAQLRSMAAAIGDHPDRVEIRIIPFASPDGVLVGGAGYQLLDFASPHLPAVVWHESAAGAGLIEKPDQVRKLGIAFAQAHDAALTREKSLALIERHARDL